MSLKIGIGAAVCLMLVFTLSGGAMAHGGRGHDEWRDRYEERGVRVWVDPYHDRHRGRDRRERHRDRERCDRDRGRDYYPAPVMYDHRGRVLREVLPGQFMAVIATDNWR